MLNSHRWELLPVFLVILHGVLTNAVLPPSAPQSGNNAPSHCERFPILSKLDSPGLTIVKVTHFLDEPMIAAIVDQHPNQLAFWYTYNATTHLYEPNLIHPCAIKNGVFVDFMDMQRGEVYYGAIATSSTNGLPVTSDIEVIPTPTDFVLTKDPSKPSHGSIVRLYHTPEGPRLKVRQLLFADDMGNLEPFILTTKSGATRNCVLFSLIDKNNPRATVYCFDPLTSKGQDNDAMHFFQEFPLHAYPLLTSLGIGSKTLVMVSDNANGNPTGKKNDHGSIVKVWAHAQGDGLLQLEQTIQLPSKILTMDSAVGQDGIPILAVGTSAVGGASADTISVYSYDTRANRFMLIQEIKEMKLVQLTFQKILETGEILLVTLTNEDGNNLHFYIRTLGSSYTPSWEYTCCITVRGAYIIEPSSFFHRGVFGAHILAVTPAGPTIVETKPLGKP